MPRRPRRHDNPRPGRPPPQGRLLRPRTRALIELIEAANNRVEVQKAFYEEGRITLDRFIGGLDDLCEVQLLAASTDAQRAAIYLRRIDLLKQVENREKAELEVGRGTQADVAESRQARLRAEFDWKTRRRDQAEKATLLRRIDELERKVEELRETRVGKRRP